MSRTNNRLKNGVRTSRGKVISEGVLTLRAEENLTERAIPRVVHLVDHEIQSDPSCGVGRHEGSSCEAEECGSVS